MGTIRIPLTQGKYATIDEEDYDLVSSFKWFYSSNRNTGYAVNFCPKTRKSLRMHRLILGAKPSEFVDHRDGDGLNNSRSNIRICTTTQNAWNARMASVTRSGFIGVHWDNRKKKWQARIFEGRIQRHLGYFDDPVQAAKVRDAKAYELRGEFALLNFQADNKDESERESA